MSAIEQELGGSGVFMWLVANGYFDTIVMEYMEKGHTKCRCDGSFGLGKKSFRNRSVDSMQQII